MSDVATAPAPQSVSRRSALPFVLLVALTGTIAAGWYGWQRVHPSADSELLSDAPSAQPTPPSVGTAEVDTLRSRLDDAASVNRALREQVLGLTQRVGLVEDGLAGMERGAAPGIDALRLAEADFLLRLGMQRLQLFQDVSGARNAYALADAELSEVSDPRATSVRQTLALERDALAAAPVADLPALLGRIDGLAAAVAHWPMPGIALATGKDGQPEPSWYGRVIGSMDRYFRVRRVDPKERSEGGPLLRERIALDLSRARLLLLRGEGAAALTALTEVRTTLRARFDTTDAGVNQALAVLDELVSAPLAPTLPNLGESQRELARLRAGARAPAAPAAAAEPAAVVPSLSAPESSPAGPAELAPVADGAEPPTAPLAIPNTEAVPAAEATSPAPDADQG